MYRCSVKNIDTRAHILLHMFTDIHKNGFQGLRADKVMAELEITKGAMYHYFPSKQSIGLAVIDEIIKPNYLAFYRDLDQSSAHPVDSLKAHINMLAGKCTDETIALGCPLNNLIQEMSPVDETFRLHLKYVMDRMQLSSANALRRAQASGTLRADVDVDAVAHFYLSTLEGAYGIAKVQKSMAVFKATMEILCQYLESLRK